MRTVNSPNAVIGNPSLLFSALTEQDCKLFFQVAEDLDKVETQSDFVSIVERDIRILIPHEISVCGFINEHTYEVTNMINVQYPDGFLRKIMNKKGVATVVESPVVKSWSRGATIIQVDDSLMYNPKYVVWTEAAKKYSVKNMLVNGKRDGNRGCFSYFNFANHLVDMEIKHLRLMRLLTPYLHFALARVANHNSAIAVKLSKRELQILNLMNCGMKNTDIASKLCLSTYTIKNHLRSLFLKLDSENRVQAIFKAKQNRLID